MASFSNLKASESSKRAPSPAKGTPELKVTSFPVRGARESLNMDLSTPTWTSRSNSASLPDRGECKSSGKVKPTLPNKSMRRKVQVIQTPVWNHLFRVRCFMKSSNIGRPSQISWTHQILSRKMLLCVVLCLNVLTQHATAATEKEQRARPSSGRGPAGTSLVQKAFLLALSASTVDSLKISSFHVNGSPNHQFQGGYIENFLTPEASKDMVDTLASHRVDIKIPGFKSVFDDYFHEEMIIEQLKEDGQLQKVLKAIEKVEGIKIDPEYNGFINIVHEPHMSEAIPTHGDQQGENILHMHINLRQPRQNYKGGAWKASFGIPRKPKDYEAFLNKQDIAENEYSVFFQPHIGDLSYYTGYTAHTIQKTYEAEPGPWQQGFADADETSYRTSVAINFKFTKKASGRRRRSRKKKSSHRKTHSKNTKYIRGQAHNPKPKTKTSAETLDEAENGLDLAPARVVTAEDRVSDIYWLYSLGDNLELDYDIDVGFT